MGIFCVFFLNSGPQCLLSTYFLPSFCLLYAFMAIKCLVIHTHGHKPTLPELLKSHWPSGSACFVRNPIYHTCGHTPKWNFLSYLLCHQSLTTSERICSLPFLINSGSSLYMSFFYPVNTPVTVYPASLASSLDSDQPCEHTFCPFPSR